MIARRRVAFLRLCKLLREVEADLDNLAAVRALNLGVLLTWGLRTSGHTRQRLDDLDWVEAFRALPLNRAAAMVCVPPHPLAWEDQLRIQGAPRRRR